MWTTTTNCALHRRGVGPAAGSVGRAPDRRGQVQIAAHVAGGTGRRVPRIVRRPGGDGGLPSQPARTGQRRRPYCINTLSRLWWWRCRGPCGEERPMSNRTRLIAGAFVAAAVAVPLYAAIARPTPLRSRLPGLPGVVRQQRRRQVPVLFERPAAFTSEHRCSIGGNGPNAGLEHWAAAPGTPSTRHRLAASRSFFAVSGSITAVWESIGVSVTNAGSGDTRSAILRRPASITALAAGLSVTAL